MIAFVGSSGIDVSSLRMRRRTTMHNRLYQTHPWLGYIHIVCTILYASVYFVGFKTLFVTVQMQQSNETGKRCLFVLKCRRPHTGIYTYIYSIYHWQPNASSFLYVNNNASCHNLCRMMYYNCNRLPSYSVY